MNNNKTIIRVRKESNFVIVSRFPLEDERLTWEARGLYGFLLAKPDNWQISLTNLTNSSPSGYDKAKRILSELVGYKYIQKEDRRNYRGQYSYPTYTIYELPYDGYFTAVANPITVKPVAAKTDSENPLTADPRLIKKQVSKETKKTKKTKKTTTTTDDYIWPGNIDSTEKAAISSIIKDEEHDVVQEILYEIAGQTKFKKGPVSLFCFFLKLKKDDQFVPSVSHRIKSKLDAKAEGERNYQRILEESERRAIEELNLEGKS
jgi:hypothetical protein